MESFYIKSQKDAFILLEKLSVSKSLISHHKIVLQTAEEMLNQLPISIKNSIDSNLVMIGASIHDIGKVLFPNEESEPGSFHELAGKRLLLSLGIPLEISRFSMIHSTKIQSSTIEEIVVRLADVIWTGSRDFESELALAYRLSIKLEINFWYLFSQLNEIFDNESDKCFRRYKNHLLENKILVR
ncbi:HD domain protein [Leptospira broomii serovar Hurstbridge str. 5399]|uniref:HD domain protein n=1 Tax=Leptospira broomii serovar Hurstbridge str. 5399 TaxID=1049789 RepID=T0GJ77_9LEPT|nr:HD domain-containing protein [Leptospira broomii]EQA45433.1 HD domain protein [Leptospira broomii serovar Hurstbridge str. 5399]